MLGCKMLHDTQDNQECPATALSRAGLHAFMLSPAARVEHLLSERKS